MREEKESDLVEADQLDWAMGNDAWRPRSGKLVLAGISGASKGEIPERGKIPQSPM
jgi:hypothetical protein